MSGKDVKKQNSRGSGDTTSEDQGVRDVRAYRIADFFFYLPCLSFLFVAFESIVWFFMRCAKGD